MVDYSLVVQVLDSFWLELPVKFDCSVAKPDSNRYHKEKTHQSLMSMYKGPNGMSDAGGARPSFICVTL